MKNYEITFITKEPFDTAQGKDNLIKKLLDILGGKILNISSLGQKTFAYTIKKEKSGFYTTVIFEIEPAKIIDFNKKLALEEEILRYLIISAPVVQVTELPAKVKKTEILPKPFDKTQGRPEKAIEIEPEKSLDKARESEIVPVEKVEKLKKVAKPKTKPIKVSKAVKELTEEPVSESERLDALDKKLEELLKE